MVPCREFGVPRRIPDIIIHPVMKLSLLIDAGLDSNLHKDKAFGSMRDTDGEFLNATPFSCKGSRSRFVKISLKPGPSAGLVMVTNRPVVAEASGLSSLFHAQPRDKIMPVKPRLNLLSEWMPRILILPVS